MENPSARTSSLFLPLASLALSAAAFSMGAPGRLAREAHLLPSIPTGLSMKAVSAAQVEPALFRTPSSERPGAKAPHRRRAGI